MGIKEKTNYGDRKPGNISDAIQKLNTNITNNIDISVQTGQFLKEQRENLKNTALGTMYKDVPTEITYFKRVTTNLQNNEINVEANGINNNVSISKSVYHKINGLQVFFSETSNWSQTGDRHDGTGSSEISGTFKTTPGSMLISDGDLFIMPYWFENRLFSIKSVTKDTIEEIDIYICEFTSEINDATYEQVIQNISKEYKFIASYIGEGYRTVLELQEYEDIKILETIMQDINQLYYDKFYDDNSSNFVLRSKEIDFIDGENKNREEYLKTFSLKVMTLDQYKNHNNNILNTSKQLIANKYLDKYINYFIYKNGFFPNDIYGRSHKLTFSIDEENYNETYFHAIETCSKDLIGLTKAYVEPGTAVLNKITNNYKSLYLGSVNYYSSNLNIDNVYNVIPEELYEIIVNDKNAKTKVKDDSEYIFTNKISSFLEIINIFFNKYDNERSKHNNIIRNILKKNEKLSILLNDGTRDNELFYILPMINFIISYVVIDLIKTEDDMNDPLTY